MKKAIVVISILLIIILVLVLYIENDKLNKKLVLDRNKEATKQQLLLKISDHYNAYVETIKKANLYILKNNQYQIIGSINSETVIELNKIIINVNTTYFPIKNTNYYINYKDIKPIKKMPKYDKDYTNYLVFNENIVTNKITNFYQDGKLVYTINKSLSLPIIIKDTNKYYVEYMKNLYYVKKEDVVKIKKSDNTNKIEGTGARVIVYHKFYKEGTTCNSVICYREDLFEKQMKYLHDNNYYSLTMKALELFLDGKIRIPEKSVIITIDDGGKSIKNIAFPILEKYKVNATLFLITSKYKKEDYYSPYVELHSHSHNLHVRDTCPNGKYGGGGIRCLEEDVILNDLKKSRQLLNNTTVFCYPFYEYNEYAIRLLKKAGFTMAFEDGGIKVTRDANKMTLPRSTILIDTTFEQFVNMVK